MTTPLSKRKSPSVNASNCITEEIQNHKSRTHKLKSENDIYESKHDYIVTKTFHGANYHRIKEGDVVPKNAVIHHGNI